MWTGQGRAFCGRFQEMLSSWVHQWCWTVLQRRAPHYCCEWIYAGLISGSAQGHCLNTGGESGFLFWCGSCRRISPMTPGVSGFLAKPSSASDLPYTKAPPFQAPWSIFQVFADTGPKGHGACAQCNGSRLAHATGSSWAFWVACCSL